MLLEGAQFSPDDLNPILDPLDFTDQIFTSIEALTEFLHHWKAMNAVSFDPISAQNPQTRRPSQ